MVSHWSLSDNKSPQVSSLADLNNAVAWTVSTRPVISKSSSPCTNLLVIVPRARITIGLIVTFMFHNFLNFPCKSEVHIPIFLFFEFHSVVCRESKILNPASSLFLWIIIRSGRLTQIRWSPCISKEFVCHIPQDRFWVVHIPFVRMVEFQLLEQFPMDHLAHPIVPSLIPFLR